MSVRAMLKKSILESDMYNQSISLSTLITILVDMAVALLIGLIIYEIYKRYFQGVIYSRSFATSLIGMTVLTCMVTLAISTNIVISLGMVGALSIVRFRTAIKEPMDIMYLFWAITMGITVGASMYLLAAIGMFIMLVLIIFMNRKQEKGEAYMLLLHASSDEAVRNALAELKEVDYALKSRTLRGDFQEVTLTLDFVKNTAFTEKIRQVEGIDDVTLISYNGEYHG